MSNFSPLINKKVLEPYHQSFGDIVSASGVCYARTNRSMEKLIDTSVYPSYFFDNLRGKKVLDVGTGLGELVVDLKKQGVNAMGIDICGDSPNFQQYPKLFKVASALHTGFRRESFDFVYSSFSVFYKAEESSRFKLQVLSEMKRILKQGGKIRLGAVRKSEIKDLVKKVGGLKVTGQSQFERWMELTKVA